MGVPCAQRERAGGERTASLPMGEIIGIYVWYKSSPETIVSTVCSTYIAGMINVA